MSPIAEPNDEKMWRLLPFVFDFSDISNTAAHPSEYGSFFWGCYFVLNLWKAEPFVLIFSPDCFIFSFITPFFYFWIYNKHIYTYTIQPSPMKNQFSQHGFLAILPVICIVNSIIHDLKYTIFFRKSLFHTTAIRWLVVKNKFGFRLLARAMTNGNFSMVESVEIEDYETLRYSKEVEKWNVGTRYEKL